MTTTLEYDIEVVREQTGLCGLGVFENNNRELLRTNSSLRRKFENEKAELLLEYTEKCLSTLIKGVFKDFDIGVDDGRLYTWNDLFAHNVDFFYGDASLTDDMINSLEKSLECGIMTVIRHWRHMIRVMTGWGDFEKNRAEEERTFDDVEETWLSRAIWRRIKEDLTEEEDEDLIILGDKLF
jgi:hypothetical protein